MSEFDDGSSDNRRLSRRYPVAEPVRLRWQAPSRWLRRRRTVEVVGELADVSVSGAAVRVEDGIDFGQLDAGRRVDVLLGGHDGLANVRQVREGFDGVIIGIEFGELSPGLQERIYEIVAARRDRYGQLAAFWTDTR